MHFQIGNISCTNCTNNIEKKIKENFGFLGLIDVTANFMLKKLIVKISLASKNAILPENIVEAITEMGKECEFEYSETVQGKTDRKTSFKKIYSESGSKKNNFNITKFTKLYR